MIGVHYTTIGIVKKFSPKNGATIFRCNKNHLTNFLVRKSQKTADGIFKMWEECPKCNGQESTIGAELKKLNDKRRKLK